MSEKMDVAVRGVKEMNMEIVQWENRLQFVQDEVKRLNASKEAMQGEIDKKTADYNIYMAQRDAETKKIRQDVTDDRAQMDKDKAEFHKIVQQFQKEKQGVLEAKQTHEVEKAKNEAQLNNIRQFIIAVQRASSLLGL
jgi:phage-related protein